MVDWILSIVSAIVSPDWGELIGLIPLAVGGIVVVYLLFLARRATTVPPTRLRPLATPGAPAGIHMPGPSLAPFLAAVGFVCFFLALLFSKDRTLGLATFGVGLVLLVLALLYWGREATRDYDALEPRRELALPEHAGPPPGVHVPGPSFRPLVFSIAATILLLGLVVNVAIALGGLLMLVIAMLGWLRDARLEYRETVRADATGHLENIPAPRFPTGTLLAFVVIGALTTLVAAGVIPPQAGTASGGTASASGKPAASAAASGKPAGSAAAGEPTPVPGAGGPAAATLEITASGVQFDATELAAPADKPFAITFHNNDAGIPHNVAIHKDSPTGAEVWKGTIFSGSATQTYQVPALPAGTYGFVCSVHPNMSGTLTVK